MSTITNLQIALKQAEDKKRSIETYNSALEAKKANINKQLAANKKKLEKLDFFLKQTEEAIKSKNS